MRIISVYVVTEWNCMTYEDSYDAVRAAFFTREEVEKFISEQPEQLERYDGRWVDRDGVKKERFCVQEFQGAKEIESWHPRKDGSINWAKIT